MAKQIKSKTKKRILSSEIISLRKGWNKRIKDLRYGKQWMFNEVSNKRARHDKASGIEECIMDINYLLKHRL